MKPSIHLKEKIKSGQMSTLELLRLAARETKDADLRGLLDGAANIIQRQDNQIVRAIEEMASKLQTQKVA